MRRIAGTAIPAPSPMTKRPPSIGTTVEDAASNTTPTMLSTIPDSTSIRACPRSASGARAIWATKPARKPMPMTAPSADSLMP